MAPHAGFDAEHIRDKARKDFLYLLEGVRGKKNLVIERSLAGPIGVVVKVSTLQDYGVDKFFFLENKNADTSQRNVVFMARGECARHAQSIAEQIKRLQRESQTGHEFHIFWIPRRTLVSDKLLEEAGVLGDVNIAELPLYFFPLERDVLSLELDNAFQDLFLFKDTTPTYLMAKALMGIQSKHGLFPRVIGKGDNAKRVAELLTRMRQEILAGDDANESARSGLTPSNTIESVIIIDREVDFVTPLLTQLTYEGLIDELWGIQNNQADIDSTIVGAPSQSTSQTSTPSRKRKIQLDSSDKLYDGLRDANFAIVGTLLNKVARRLQSDYDSRHTSKTTAELKDFVKKLPGYQTEHQSLKVHTGLAEEIMKYTRTDQFSRMLEVQQNLAAGADPTSQFDAIEELIARDVPLREILRLLCIYSCISGGIKSKDFDQFRRLVLEGYGYQHLLTLHNLENLQLFLSRTSPMASMIPMPGSGAVAGTKTNYTYLRKQLRLIVDEVNEQDPNDIAYVYSGYAPLSIRLVQCILQKQYLLSITRGSAGAGAGTAAGSGAQGWRGFDEAVKHARGQTFDELQKGEDKAVKARALLSGGGDKKTVFVVFVGGITFTEIAALRFIAKKEEGRFQRPRHLSSLAMRSTQEILLEEGNCIGSGSLMNLEELDHHLESILASPADITKTLPAALRADSCTSYNPGSSMSRETPRTESEIIVRIDGMDIDTDTDNMASVAVSQEDPPSHRDRSPLKESRLLKAHYNLGNSFESSASAASDHSDLTSLPSTSSPSSKATTPVDVDTLKEPLPIHIDTPITTNTKTRRRTFDVRPRVSIPTDVAPYDYANQCIAAAESSRLNPYALHQDEYLMLRNHLSHAQVTTYLNIRNGILRLWMNNPRIGVSREEAVGCAKDPRWFDTASVCYDWLVRSGYINFGCAEIPPIKKRKGKTVVIIGAGMAGLGLFQQYAREFQDLGEEAPRVVVLEGRNRLGGRVKSQHLIGFKGRRHSVECGGMIITGGQMALPYYPLRPDATLYDANGKAVDEKRDRLVEKLYNDCLERIQPSKLIEGNKDLMDEGRDSSSEVEEATAALPQATPVSQQSLDRATGKTHVEPAYKARLMGWALKDHAHDATLGSVMDEAITQLMNWHIANLDIGGWDIDAGNEWEGKHTMVIGGYQSVPWGLANTPSRLNVRKNTDVKRIFYDPDGSGAARVESEDGYTIEADYVVSTIPLGVLKHGNVEFNPPLPASKTDAIGRLGYAFWDTNKDIFGCLRTPTSRHSLKQAEYASQRGRCFQWFNVSNTSDAGFDTEHSKNDELVAEATEVLRSVYGAKVPQPVHSIFARDDYQTMAKAVGNLFFAGEHTTETHPATVHGAYLTGLPMLGPIEVPTPLVLPKDSIFSSQGLKRKGPDDGSVPPSPKSRKQARIDEYELAAWQHIVTQIGERPWKPQKVAANAYLLYSKASFESARKRCEEGRRPGKGKPGPNEVRVMTSKMWKEATPEDRKPFEDQAAEIKQKYSEALKIWEVKAREWDQQYLKLKKQYEEDHKLELEDEGSTGDDSGRERRRAKVSNYAESEGSDIDMEG
ncbi:Sec1-like protein [Hypoxylon sp. EC38]|nr:Sec1-like protein [Hypoxylon sp. EC38]